MNIRLTPEQEKIIQEELTSGHFRSAEEVIAEALRALREKAHPPTSEAPNAAQVEAVREMLAFIEAHHARLHGISVKELIHEGHRL